MLLLLQVRGYGYGYDYGYESDLGGSDDRRFWGVERSGESERRGEGHLHRRIGEEEEEEKTRFGVVCLTAEEGGICQRSDGRAGSFFLGCTIES